MYKNLKFSIVTTSYNYADYIKETIESVKIKHIQIGK